MALAESGVDRVAFRPASIYSYGDFFLLHGETPRMKRRGGVVLLMMLIINITMAFALYDTCWLRWILALLQNHEGRQIPRDRLYESETYGSKATSGYPNIDYVLVVLGSVYICVSEAREDKEILCCARPSASTNFCLRLLRTLP